MEKNLLKFHLLFVLTFGLDLKKIDAFHVEYRKRLHNLHNNLQFLPDRMKIKKCNKFVCIFMIKTIILRI